ncbi:MAG TPA: serine/threonine-protein kinase [Chroococcidiopsis sp.]
MRERYRPCQLLGQGGFGRTFLAVDQDIPSQPYCVVKQLCLQTSDPYSLKRAAELFQREAVRLEQLGDHPQIPKLQAHFEQNRWLYLVQDFIDGQSLDQELQQQGPFSPAKVLQVLQDLLPVLQFIHDRHIIHRDIKPANIMRRKSDQKLILIDFGIAKQISGATLSQTGTVAGTPAYMAPEQLRGKVVPASDLYSLGVTCIYLLTQVSPAEMFDVMGDRWLWQEHLPPGTKLDVRLRQALDKLLESTVKQRYKSASAVLEFLAGSQRLTVTAAPTTPVESAISLPHIQRWLSQPPKPSVPPAEPAADYTRLETLLAKGKWKDANAETWAILCRVLGKRSNSPLFAGDIAHIPCPELWRINQLWVRYSRGRFGFSVQTQIYVGVGCDYGSFCDRVGWQAHNADKFNDQFKFEARAPMGHLPSRYWSGGAQWWKHAEAMAKKLMECSTSECQDRQQ